VHSLCKPLQLDQELRVGGYLLQPPSEATIRSWLTNTTSDAPPVASSSNERTSPGREAVMQRVVETIAKARAWSAKTRETQGDNSTRTSFALMKRELAHVSKRIYIYIQPVYIDVYI
jgi:hypothetical protein